MSECAWKPSPSYVLLRECCGIALGVDPAVLIGRSHARRYSFPRQIAYFVLREAFPQLSFPMVGRVFGRDHSTVIYGIGRARAARERDPLLRAKSDALIAIGQAIGRRTIGREEALALAEFLIEDPTFRPQPGRKVGGGGPAAVQAFVFPTGQPEKRAVWSESDDAQLLAAIQADVDAEADALLARDPPNVAPSRDQGLTGRKGATEAEFIAARRREAEAARLSHERYWLRREAMLAGRTRLPRPLSDMPA